MNFWKDKVFLKKIRFQSEKKVFLMLDNQRKKCYYIKEII